MLFSQFVRPLLKSALCRQTLKALNLLKGSLGYRRASTHSGGVLFVLVCSSAVTGKLSAIEKPWGLQNERATFPNGENNSGSRL